MLLEAAFRNAVATPEGRGRSAIVLRIFPSQLRKIRRVEIALALDADPEWSLFELMCGVAGIMPFPGVAALLDLLEGPQGQDGVRSPVRAKIFAAGVLLESAV